MITLTIIATIKMLRKAGYGGWEFIVPFYNLYVYFELAFGKGNGIKFLWLLCPIVNIYWSFKYVFTLPKRYGFGVAMGVLSLFLSPVATWIMGFGSSDYIPVE